MRGSRDRGMDKKAQFKIQQTAFMIIAVMLFFILAGMFYLAIYVQSLAQEANALRERRAIVNAEMFAESPEMTCGASCIDSDRMMVLKNASAFKEFWPYARVEIRRIYPPGLGRECTFANYPKCDTYTLMDKRIENVREFSNFVALCRRESTVSGVVRKCELGKIVLGVEVKNV